MYSCLCIQKKGCVHWRSNERTKHSNRDQNSPQDIRQGYYKLQCVNHHSNTAPRSFDWAHYKLLSNVCKMMVYMENSYTTQNLHVCKTGIRKKMHSFPFNTKCYFIKNGYIFLDCPVIRKYCADVCTVLWTLLKIDV